MGERAEPGDVVDDGDAVAWLHGQYDVAEARARAAGGDAWSFAVLRGTYSVVTAGYLAAEALDVGSTAIVAQGRTAAADAARRMMHIALNDPEYVLADIAARRLILDAHRRVTFTDVDLGIENAQVCWSCHGALIPEDTEHWTADHVPIVQVPFPCRTVRLLTLPYVHRPGYREEWRP